MPKVGFRLGLLLCWAIAIATFKWWVIGPFRADDFLIGLGIELCCWGWLAVFALALDRIARPWVGAAVFYAPFYFSAGLVFAYTYFFDSAVERRFSLLDTDLDGMRFFFQDVLPARGFA